MMSFRNFSRADRHSFYYFDLTAAALHHISFYPLVSSLVCTYNDVRFMVRRGSPGLHQILLTQLQ